VWTGGEDGRSGNLQRGRSGARERGGLARMKFGIFDHLERIPGVPLAQLLADRLELVRLADEGGITGYHLAEHHGSELCMAPNQETFLAAVAASTTRIRLGPLVKCLPLHHPLRIVEDICILDNLSGGRVDYGVGRGAAPSEHVFFGHPWQEARERFEETLDIVVQGLRTGKIDSQGRKHFDFPEIETAMEPAQAPNPPFWFASRDPEYAGRRGMSCVVPGRVTMQVRERYLAAWEANRDADDRLDHPGQQPLIANADIVAIADTPEEARAIAQRGQEGLQRRVTLAHEYDRQVLPAEEVEVARSSGAPRVAHDLPAGTLEMVLDHYLSYAEEATADYVALMIPAGDMTHREAMRTLDSFCEHIVPAVAHLGP